MWIKGLPAGGGSSSGATQIGKKVVGGTPGSILFVDLSGNLGQDNANLFWDDTNNRQGIGTNTPTATLHILEPISTTGSPTALSVVGGAHTTLTASTEATDINFNLTRNVQFATGAITNQRAVTISAPTYQFVGSSTITNAATVAITGAPQAGTNATITRPIAFSVTSTNTDGTCFFGDTALSAFNIDPVAVEICPPATTGRLRGFRFAPGNLTSVAGGQMVDVNWNMSHTITFNTGTLLALQTSFVISPPTLAATTAKTITSAATLYITGEPLNGSNVTFDSSAPNTGSFGLLCVGGGHFQSIDTRKTPACAISGCRNAFTALSNGYEYQDMRFSMGGSIQWTTAPPATQRLIHFDGGTPLASTASATINDAATVYIGAAPVASTNVTITRKYALWVDADDVRFDNRLLVGANNTSYAGPAAQITIASNNDVVLMRNTTTSGYSSIVALDSSNTAKCGFGYGNASANAHRANQAFIWLASGVGFNISSNDTNDIFTCTSTPALSFFGVAVAARQTSGANITNNVTAGGVNATIANFTDLTTYANDAATIRNDIYQLARGLKIVNDALRLYGLLT